MDPPITAVYSTVGSLDIELDILLPPCLLPGAYPAVVFFHGQSP